MSKRAITTENLPLTQEPLVGPTSTTTRQPPIPPMIPRTGGRFAETAASIQRDRQHERRDCRRFELCLTQAAIFDAVCVPCQECTAFHIPKKKRRDADSMLVALSKDPWRMKE